MKTYIYQVRRCEYNKSLDAKSAENAEIMRQEGITHVINLIAHRGKAAPKPEELG